MINIGKKNTIYCFFILIFIFILNICINRLLYADDRKNLPIKWNEKSIVVNDDVNNSWVEINGKIYGAKPDSRGSIGGGDGYFDIISKGDFHVFNLEELLDAMRVVKAGQIIYLDDNAVIDCSSRVLSQKFMLNIPEGVTLASGRGHAGSQGAIILSTRLATRPLIRAAGPGVRITGLRVRGPEPGRNVDPEGRPIAFIKYPISVGIESDFSGMRVDNCEISCWSYAAISLRAGVNHNIHHNYIHHNQHAGLGYGICLDKSEAIISYNLFNFNRHSIAGTGRPGSGYEASHNIEMGESFSHCFDMHGGRDRKDGTNIAGSWIRIYNNTFRALTTPIVIRGIPEKLGVISRNWFVNHKNPQESSGPPAVRFDASVKIEDNLDRK